MTSSSTILRLRFLAASTVAALTAFGWTSHAAADDPAEGLELTVRAIDRGHVASEASTSIGAAGTLPDGTPALYINGSGDPTNFTVVNAETGALVSSSEVRPRTLGSAMCVLPNGSAYFSTRDGGGTTIYHWDAQTHAIEEVLDNPVGGRLIRELVFEDGRLYGSTYSNTKVFSYDPASGEVRDYGSVLPAGDGDIYAEGFAIHQGIAYVGTGMQNGHVVALDLDTGGLTELTLPAGYDRIERFYRFQKVGNLIAMAFSPGASGTNTLFWDTDAEEWACDGAIDGSVSLNDPYTEATADGRFYFKSGGEIWELDATDCSTAATGWIDTGLKDSGRHRAMSLLRTGQGGDDEYVLLGLNQDGSFWRFNPVTGEHAQFGSQVTSALLTAHSIHVAPDGRVYMGIYLSPSVLGRFDPATETTEQISGPSQADSWLTYEGDLLIGSYGNAVVHRGDPAAEWNWGTNPSQQFRLIGEEQDRIIQMATNGDLVAIATVSDYGVRGGALTLTDMDGRRDTYRDLVEAQSTVSVTFGPGGLVYAGTSIRGGLSSANSPLDAHLVIVDPTTGAVLQAMVPVADNDVVAGLAVVDESIWGVTNSGHVFEFDTNTREVVRVRELGTEPSASPWGLASTIELRPTDGLLYGVAGDAIFAADPRTGATKLLLQDTRYKRLDIGADGTIYALDGTHLYELDFTPEEGAEDDAGVGADAGTGDGGLGAVGDAGIQPEESDGCSCRAVGARTEGAQPWGLALLLSLGLVRIARRRARR